LAVSSFGFDLNPTKKKKGFSLFGKTQSKIGKTFGVFCIAPNQKKGADTTVKLFHSI
jgi:hypothetical protein